MPTTSPSVPIPETWTGEVAALLRLGLPAALSYFGMMAMGIVDMIMIGRLGSEAFGSVSLGHTIVFGTGALGMGLVMGLDPLVSQAHGAGRHEDARRALHWGIVVGIIASLPVMAIWFQTSSLLELLGQLPHLSKTAGEYNRAQVFSVAPFFAAIACRHYLQGRGQMVPVLVIIVVANLVNVLANWILIFGVGEFPALGVQGAGIATGITRVFMLVGFALVTMRDGRRFGIAVPWSRESFSIRGIGRVLHHGIPVSIQMTLENWAFNLTMIFAGQLPRDTEACVAAHGATIKLAAVAFMLPLGFSVATSTRVGNLIGAGRADLSQRAAWCGIGLSGAVMTASAVGFVVFRNELPLLYLDLDESALAIGIAATILPIAGCFQIFDGVQVAGSGVLRGMGNNRPAAIFNFVGFYLLSLPLARWLAFPEFLGVPGLDLGIRGLWWGLALGLAILAVCYVAWIAKFGPRRLVVKA